MKFAFYGDSHTLGGETEDHIILNKSFKEVNEEKKALLMKWFGQSNFSLQCFSLATSKRSI